MYLLIGDLHLTDRAADEYRFKIFDFLAKQQRKFEHRAIFLAGDLTDAKDRHSATLVNKVVDGLGKLRPPVFILKGNHDYRDPDNPFFKFLNYIGGLRFVSEPEMHEGLGLIPHYREQADFDAAVGRMKRAHGLLLHNTFQGAIAETGGVLSGLSASAIESLKPPLGVYAGDVHKPQRQGQVIYIGCPYHVRFGDNYEPRMLHVDEGGKKSNFYFDAPRKWSLTVRDTYNITNNDDLAPGDMVKLTIEVTREEVVDWKNIRSRVLAACAERELSVHGVKLQVNSVTTKRQRIRIEQTATAESTYDQFCKAEKLSSQVREAGRKLLET